MKLWKRLAAGLLAGVLLTCCGISSSAEEANNLDTKVISISTEATKSKPAKVEYINSDAKKNSIKLKWTASQGATSYIVKYSTDDGETWKKKTTKETEITFKNLKSGKKYYFKIAAKNSAGRSAYSKVISVKTESKKDEFSVTPVSELTYKYGTYCYNNSPILISGVEVTGYTGNSDTLYIPDEIRGFPVIKVKLTDQDYNIKNLIAPKTTLFLDVSYNTAEKIEYLNSPVATDKSAWAWHETPFSKTSSLKTVVFPSGATVIEGFYKCVNLKDVTIPDTTISIKYCAFYGCQSLTNITIRGNDAYISESAFAECTNLTNVTMEGVKWIGPSAFKGCSSLKTVKIPDSVTYIDTRAFTGCTNIAAIYKGETYYYNDISFLSAAVER